MDDKARPSPNFGKLFVSVAELKSTVAAILGASQEKVIAQRVLHFIVHGMSEDGTRMCWFGGHSLNLVGLSCLCSCMYM